MAARRHKRDTETFDTLTFSEQAKSISAMLVNVERAIRRHVRDERATSATRRKVLAQVRPVPASAFPDVRGLTHAESFARASRSAPPCLR